MDRRATTALLVGSLLVTTAEAEPAWEPFGLADSDVLTLRVSGGSLYACAHAPGFTGGRGLWRSNLTDPSGAWESLGAVGPELSAVWVHGRDTDVILVTVLEAAPGAPRVLRTRDGGLSWTRADDGIDAGRLWSIDGGVDEDPTVYVGSDRGIFASDDLGDSWVCVRRDAGHVTTRRVVVDPHLPRVVYSAEAFPDDDGRVVRTTNAGGDWSEAAGSLHASVNRIVTDPSSGRVYATAGGSVGGLLFSDDAGESWQEISLEAGEPFFAAAVSPHTGAPLLVAKLWSPAPVYVSDDAGRSWWNASRGLPGEKPAILDLAADPLRPGVFYAALGASARGVMRIEIPVLVDRAALTR